MDNIARIIGSIAGQSRLLGVVFGALLAGTAQADYFITGVAQGTDGGFGFSGFHFAGEDGSSSNPRDSDGNAMTGSSLGTITAGPSFPAASPYVGIYDDDDGEFYASLSVGGVDFTVTGTLFFDGLGEMSPDSSVAVNFDGSAPPGLADTTISLTGDTVCCGGATAPPNSLITVDGVPVISLWGWDESTIGLDLRLEMLLVDGDVQVPLPAAAWLFGSAILGLFGVARRKKA